ncbi:hypothetical protein BFP70_00735 [Thioclava sp. SK-1]|uniref:rhamnan synthesis F family protein n=1 Tax=Thioclava sp. SK-1 TaxID=1889770 RepID=UPI0008252F45|nr:rhamnan synthesis F family protein [Thioclava sp. SK-1]OCX66719.1 hypothetical protein BFP70_00735 [Thioclava sp. SK-1]
MIPAWKVKREILRFGKQFKAVVPILKGWPDRVRYDVQMRPQVIRTEGKLVLGDHVAIVLMYQPSGLLPSFLRHLDHLRDKGFNPLIVSNAPIAPSDLERLKDHAALIVQRPNFGYDFGGYREGVMTLADRGPMPSTLIIMNDSNWFPLRDNCTLIETAMADPADLYGIFYNTKHIKVNHRHVQSYFYRFGERVLHSPNFLTYWRRMPLYNDKFLVVRRGEVRLSGWFAERGFTINTLLKPEAIRDAAIQMSDDEVRRVIDMSMKSDLREAHIFAGVIARIEAGQPWREEADRVLQNSRFAYYLMNAHPALFLGRLNMPVMKKSRELVFWNQRRVVIEEGWLSQISPMLRDEVLHWDDDFVPPELSAQEVVKGQHGVISSRT